MKKYIDKSRKELLQKIEWLEQKLDETRKLEQFLNAANQQLQANEQQLKAANQQLRATEQQLRASNQQLKAAEKEARTAKEMYKKSLLLRNAILESPQKIIVFALDAQYRYLDFTTLHKQTMKEIWGVDIQVGDRMLDFIKNADDRSKAKANFDRALRGEYFVLQEEYGDKQLKRTFYEDHYNPVFGPDGHKIIGVSVYVVEITRQKETEQRLQKQVQEYTALNKKYKLQNEKLNALNRQLQATERQLRTVNKQLAKREEILTEAQKIAELGHWELDLIHDSLSWSDETFRIFGFKPQEFDPSYPLFLERVHPDDRKKVDDAYNQSLKNRTDYEVEHRILLKSGEMKYVIEKCHTHYNNNGQPTHSIGTVLDVTRQKLTEEALRETMLQYQSIFNSTSDAMLI
ncbi:MAG TPA: PAS domain S-box protein, partial [Bacteroidetes bacterium]|nr:PAS domain S-box protein [Bacteroidota bacterium]